MNLIIKKQSVSYGAGDESFYETIEIKPGDMIMNQLIDSRKKQMYPIYKIDETIGSAVIEERERIRKLSWWKRLLGDF